jgi:hypothetical protein
MKNTQLEKITIEKLSSQFVKHRTISEQHKKPRLESWVKIDKLLANKRTDFIDGVVHVPLGKANGFIKTWLSKVDNPLTFKYKHGEIADIKKSLIMNGIREKDQNTGRWNWKDLLGKTQACAYGRAIYFYTARSPKGVYESELSLIDCFRFHIDPRCGGQEKEKARWMGWSGVELEKEELQKMEDNKDCVEENMQILLAMSGNSQEESEEDAYIKNRYSAINNTGKETTEHDEDVYRLYRWFETIGSQRYVMLVTKSGLVVQAKKIEEEWQSGLYPIWTWATNTSLTEFWTQGELEYQMYGMLAQEASISQMLENANKINQPQRAVNITRIKNLDQLKYRRQSIIEVTGNEDIRGSIQDMQVPSIQTPMIVYDKLEVIQATESGLTAATKGNADEDKVAIYEGNMQQVGDRFGLLNKAYAEGYYDFAILHKNGIMEHLTKSMAVKIVGTEGLSVEKVTKRDIKTLTDYDILIESSNAESQSNNIDKKNKITFLAGYKGDPSLNQKVIFEYGADTAGFSDDEIQRMSDTSEYATSQIIADASEIFQTIIQKGKADAYEGANMEFVKQLVKLYSKNLSDIDAQQAINIETYIESSLEIAQENMAKDMVKQMSEQGAIDPSKGGGENLAKFGENMQETSVSSDSLDINNQKIDPASLSTNTY